MKRYKRIALIAFILAVGFMIYSGEQWLSIDKVYQEANDVYADFSKTVRRLPAYGSADSFKSEDAANEARQADAYLGGSPPPSDRGAEGEGDEPGTQPPDNSAPQYAPAPENLYTASPAQDAAVQGNDPQKTNPQGNDPQGNIPQRTNPQGNDPQGNNPQRTNPQGNDPQGTNPQGNDPQGYDPQGGLDNTQSASPIPVWDIVTASPSRPPSPSPSPSPSAVIAAPEMTPPTPPPTPQPSPTPQAMPDPDSPIDFDALKAINGNAVAWLYSPDTAIDYPVMKAGDYSYYLDRLPDGRKNVNGSLFIDYNNASDFSGALTVIYGHNMKSGKMFGSLPGYKSQSYYNQHPFMYLYTERKSYRLDLVYGCSIKEGQWRERAFMYAENVASLMAYAANYTTFNSSVSYKSGDRVVALSTCTFEFNDARYIVLGVLRGI